MTVLVRRSVRIEVINIVVVGSRVLLVALRLALLMLSEPVSGTSLVANTDVLLLLLLLLETSGALLLGAGSVELLLLLAASTSLLIGVASGALLLAAGSAVLSWH